MKGEHTIKTLLRKLWMVTILIGLLTIQTAMPELFELFSVVPNFVFLYCVCCSLKRGSTFAPVFSAFGGLLLDALNRGAMGANGILFFLVGYGCIRLHRLLYHRTLKMVLIYVFAATIFLVWHPGVFTFYCTNRQRRSAMLFSKFCIRRYITFF